MTTTDTTQTSSPTSSQGTSEGSRTSADRFFGTVRSWGLVRGRERWVSGVSGAIATRAGVDVRGVRVAFVLLTLFGGIGVALYGALWALLPDLTGRIEAEAAHRGDVSAPLVLAVGLVVADLLLGHGLLGLGWAW